MAKEKDIPGEIWKRACELKFKQGRSNEDIAAILYREFKFKISHVTLSKRFNELRAQFNEENVGANHKEVAGERRHAAALRRRIMGEIDPAELSNKEKLQLMMDDTFVAFKMAQRDNDVRKMDICLTSFARGAVAIATLERMGIEEGGKNGSPVPLPGVKLGSKELGAHHTDIHARDTGQYSLDPRKDTIDVTSQSSLVPTLPPVTYHSVPSPENTQKLQEMRVGVQAATPADGMPGVSLEEAREIASQVEGDVARET